MIKQTYKRLFTEKQRNKIITSLLKLVYPLYLGNKFYCSCCCKMFRKFHTKGNVQRLNAKCPFCGSLERTRVLDLYLENELKLYQKDDIKILHFAPEECLTKKISAIKHVEYIDGDINPAYAQFVIDITNIKYADNYFDFIICSHVLGHVPDEIQAIKEMYRVLKTGGVAIINDSFKSRIRHNI